MKLQELFEDLEPQIYNPEEDKTVAHVKDTRKPRITLRHLHKLRKYHEFRDDQDQKRSDVVSTVYQLPADTSASSPMGGF